MDSTQQQIYQDCVKPLLSKAVNGQNVSIFAYGPTGAGRPDFVIQKLTGLIFFLTNSK